MKLSFCFLFSFLLVALVRAQHDLMGDMEHKDDSVIVVPGHMMRETKKMYKAAMIVAEQNEAVLARVTVVVEQSSALVDQNLEHPAAPTPSSPSSKSS
ncbi:hypothetical protein E8E11_002361 [Didymella keratinophila]|nr:hypothetical protein E8E11_002361 [Didymella keratinophila]